MPVPAPPRDHSPFHILVVDDSVDNADSLAMLLKLDGYDVETAYSGAEALRCFTERAPDVVLLDIAMPGIDGLTVAREMRAHPQGPLTLIALSGWTRQLDREKSREAGFNFHYSKPVDPVRLSAVLAACAGRVSALPEPEEGAGVGAPALLTITSRPRHPL